MTLRSSGASGGGDGLSTHVRVTSTQSAYGSPSSAYVPSARSIIEGNVTKRPVPSRPLLWPCSNAAQACGTKRGKSGNWPRAAPGSHHASSRFHGPTSLTVVVTVLSRYLTTTLLPSARREGSATN